MISLVEIDESEERIQLPLNCEAEYFPAFLSESEVEDIFGLLTTDYDLSKQKFTGADGTTYQLDIGKCIFANPELTDHEHLHQSLGQRFPWPPSMETVRDRLELALTHHFDICVCVSVMTMEALASITTRTCRSSVRPT